MCGCSDGNGPKVWKREIRQARTERHCSECRRDIAFGTWYVSVSGLWEDVWDRFDYCQKCWARYEAWEVAEGCSPEHGGGTLHDSIIECLMGEKELGRKYIEALRAKRIALAFEVRDIESARRFRYRVAGEKREAKKRALSHIGEGI